MSDNCANLLNVIVVKINNKNNNCKMRILFISIGEKCE